MKPIVKDVDFLFIYEVRNREIDSVCLLGAYLETRGYRVGYINTWDSMFHRHTEFRTKVAVLSACYTDGAYAYFTGHALKFEKAVDLQWEQVLMNGWVNSKVQTGWDFRGEALKTRHVCWGENNRQYLMSRYGFEENKLRVCGYLPLDFYREEFRGATEQRDRLFTRYGLDPKKKTVLFISSFAEAGKPDSEIDLLDGDKDEIRENIKMQEESQAILLDWYRRLAREEKDIQIVYRPHPAETDKPELNACAKEVPNFHVVTQESIRNWIMNCDIICNWQSTSMIELYTAKKKTLIMRPVPIPYKFSMPIFEEGHYKAVTSYEELLEGIREENPEFPIEKETLLQFYSITDQPVYERVGQYLIDTMEDPEYQSRDIGRHLSAKGRIITRVKTRGEGLRAKAVYRLSGAGKAKDGKPDPREAKIREDYNHACYYEQKMRQNRISDRELREKIDALKKMMTAKA